MNRKIVMNNINDIEIIIHFSEKWFLKQLLRYIDYAIDMKIAVHSPNNLPSNTLEFTSISFGEPLKFKFNELHIKTITASLCHELSKLYYMNTKYKIRNNCILDRIKRNIFKQNICINYEDINVILIEEFHLKKLIENCLHKTNYSLNYFDECYTECPNNCDDIYYNLNLIESSTSHLFTQYYQPNTIFLTLSHNGVPDQFVEHLPEMTFIEFISNFGGLLGIWLGISLLDLVKYIIKFI